MDNTDYRTSEVGDLSAQWHWHETFRDTAKNMYRTSYSDMIHGREVAVRSDFPAGYGGHIRSLRHDALFRNTAFDRKTHMMRCNPSRDSLPSFGMQIEGIPTYCEKPRGSKKVPTAGSVPHNPVASACRPPWALTLPLREAPSFRSVPSSMMTRTFSEPTMMGRRTPPGATLPPLGTPVRTPGYEDNHLNMINAANERAWNAPMMSEADMLQAHVGTPTQPMSCKRAMRSLDL